MSNLYLNNITKAEIANIKLHQSTISAKTAFAHSFSLNAQCITQWLTGVHSQYQFVCQEGNGVAHGRIMTSKTFV